MTAEDGLSDNVVISTEEGLDADFAAEAERHMRPAYQSIKDGFGKPDLETACRPYPPGETYLLFDVYPPLSDRGFDNVYRKNKEYIGSIDGRTELHWTDGDEQVDLTPVYEAAAAARAVGARCDVRRDIRHSADALDTENT